MIKSITVTNEANESLLLELTAPKNSGFVVLGVEGLGPPKADINSVQLATNDGSVYNSARANSRNIVIYLKFLWDTLTIEQRRQLSYKYFPIKKKIKLTVETDERTSEVYGYVEANEPNIFSNSEGTQISIVCPDAYLYSNETLVTILSGIESLFEFPFSNESLTEDLIIFGNIQSSQGGTIFYDGDAPVGIDIFIDAIGTVENLSIYNSTTREIMTIDTVKLTTLTGSPIIAGDDIYISTKKGNKKVILTRNGEEINILSCVTQPIAWFQLAKGENLFAYVADTGTENVEIRIESKSVYEGV